MAKRNSKNRLERWEVALVKAMLATRKYNDQDILAYFTRPSRSINHARVSEIRNERKHKAVKPASDDELARFLSDWPQIDPETGLNLFGDELLLKAREAMLVAVQSYNNPRTYFKSELFIVTAIISWTYLLHYYFKQSGIDYRYYRTVNGRREIAKTKYGADKYWDISECLSQDACPLDDGTERNLQFLIKLRNEIEHQMTSRLDQTISAKLQACCLNFNRTLKSLFGDEYGLESELSFALQFSSLGREQTSQLLQEIHLPEHISAMQTAFEEQLTDNEIRDPTYSYRVAFVERSVNSKGKADNVVEFVKSDSDEGRKINRVLLKETEKKKFKPADIVALMRVDGFYKFRIHDHTQLWKDLDAMNPNAGFGVWLRPKDWWWYDNWVDRVRAHCQEHKDRYCPGNVLA
jgi:hypothetical protein